MATVYQRDDQIIVGATSELRISHLNKNPYRVSLRRITETDDLYDAHPNIVGYFYGMSWALVNYLHLAHLTGGPDRLTQLEKYLDLVNQNVPRNAAFKSAFGKSPRGMEKELNKFLQKKRRPVLKLPAERFVYKGKITAQAMTTTEVALELAFLVMTRNNELAHSLIDASLTLDPNNPYLASAKGVAFQVQRQFEAGEPLVRDAHRARPKDPILAIDYGDFVYTATQVQCANTDQISCEQGYAKARQIYQAALDLHPNNVELKRSLARVLMEADKDYEGALPLLFAAEKAQPWNPELHLDIGIALMHTGKNAEAIERLIRALNWTHREDIRNRAGIALKSLGVSVGKGD